VSRRTLIAELHYLIANLPDREDWRVIGRHRAVRETLVRIGRFVWQQTRFHYGRRYWPPTTPMWVWPEWCEGAVAFRSARDHVTLNPGR